MNICNSELCCRDKLDPERVENKPTCMQMNSQDLTADSELGQMKNTKAVYLELKVISSTCLEPSSVFVISPHGLIGSLRIPQDGAVYFGCKKRMKYEEGGKGPVVNDVVIPIEDPEVSEMSRGRHFQIYFDYRSEAYYLQDLGLGFGCYLKLTQPLPLGDEQLIQVGKVFIVIKQHSKSGPDSLEVTVYGQTVTSRVFSFTPLHTHKIRIGRLPANEIAVLEDDLLSKHQATLSWVLDHWVLTDGEEGNPSTNGTW